MTMLAERLMDEFVERFYNGDYILDERSGRIKCTEKEKTISLQIVFTNSISDYAITKSNLELATSEEAITKARQTHDKNIKRLLYWVTVARNENVISERESMVSKIKRLDAENMYLKEQLTSLRILNEKLVSENKILHKLFPDNQSGTSEYGDVE